MKWTNSYAVHIPEIDREHRELFGMLVDLRRSVKAGAGPDQLQPAVKALLAHAALHFANEERRMQAAGYPSYAWHKKQHDGLARRVKQLLRLLCTAGNQPMAGQLDYLDDWLKTHTSITDRIMAAFLRNHDRSRAALAS